MKLSLLKIFKIILICILDQRIKQSVYMKHMRKDGNMLIALSPTHEFMQVSFVNGIATSKGGKHVDYITHQIVRKLCDYIEKRKRSR